MNDSGSLTALTKIAPVSQLLFGTDFPFRPVAEEISGLSTYTFNHRERAAIERGNALRLFPRLAS